MKKKKSKPLYPYKGWSRCKHNLKNLYLTATENPVVAASIVLAILAMPVIATTVITRSYDREFLKNFLAGAHGTLLELFVIGIFLLRISKAGEKRKEIRRYQEEIDDFREWESEEGARRIRGNIKRLNSVGVTAINLSYCFLEKMNLKNVDLTGSNLEHANLQGARLSGAIVKGASLKYAKLQGAYLDEADFSDVDFTGAYCHGTFFGSMFSDDDNELFYRRTNLENASLNGADLRGAMYSSAKQLSKVKTLHNAKLDTSMFEQLRRECAHVLLKPEK